MPILILKLYPGGLGGILNVPEARGFVLIEYEPVAMHGDPIRVQIDVFLSPLPPLHTVFERP